MSISQLKGASEWALLVALVFGAGAIAQAQTGEAQPGGPVIQIGESDEGVETPNLPAPNAGIENEQPAVPQYWIGLQIGAIPADHVLRAHIDLPEGQGLLVANVVPNSPAAKAGIKQHDILLRANDIELRDAHDLTDLVVAEGEKKGHVAVEVLHHGERESLNVTPETRPANAMPQQLGGGGFGGNFGNLEEGIPQQLLDQLQGRLPLEFRNMGPGVIVGGGSGGAELPNGVSVSIQKEAGKPTHITVKRGDETWEVTGDDEESLKKLPEDLRPAVEQMLQGGGVDANFGQMPEFGDGRLRERMERMEQRMQQLMERFNESGETATDAEPQK
jgi:membrane-associated protease RseP (regulator of RpoE activity)